MRYLALMLLFLCFAGSASAANRFAVCTTTCTWDGASTAMWSASSGGATGASVPGASDVVIFDGATCVGGTTCTTTMNTSPTISSLVIGGCTASTTGCILDFTVNNNNINMTTFSGTGTGTRTLKMGNGAWTVAGTSGTVWDFNIITNLTFIPNSSTLLFQATTNSTRTINTGGSLAYSTVAIGANPNGIFSFNGSINAATFNITGQNAVLLSVAGNTVTNPLTWAGTSGNEIYVFSSTPGAQAEIVGNGGTMTWIAPRDIKFTTGTYTAINSFNLGDNSGVTITPPGGGGTQACILGGWLLWRDLPEHLNDNFPAWIEKAA